MVGILTEIEVSLDEGLISTSVALTSPHGSPKISLPGRLQNFIHKPVDLWSPNAQETFRKTFERTGIPKELDVLLHRSGGAAVLRISPKAATIPWEGFPLLLDERNRERLAVIRQIDPEPVFAFSALAAGMRTLVLIGDPGPDEAFNAADAAGFIERAFDEARMTTGDVIEEVKTCRLDQLTVYDVAKEISTFAPNVVLYFGHGRERDGPQLLLGARESDWVNLSEIVSEIFPQAVIPPFWVFWACSLAEESVQPLQNFDGPAVLRALGSQQAAAVLAMRAKISVHLARPMLNTLITALASGEPLEMAAARSRAAGLTADPPMRGRMDFAAPATWSNSRPVDRIAWGHHAPFPLSWVALPLFAGAAARSDAIAFPEFSLGTFEPDARMVSLSESLAAHARLFLAVESATAEQAIKASADPSDAAVLLGAAAALRARTGIVMIPIMLDPGGTFVPKLQAWARSAHAALDPRWHDVELARALDLMARNGTAGLKALVEIPDVSIILSEPPDEPRLWDILTSASPNTHISVLGDSVPNEATGWTADTMNAHTQRLSIKSMTEDETLVVGALSFLEQPIERRRAADAVGLTDALFDQIRPYLIRIGSRFLLGARARRDALEDLTDAQRTEARRVCMHALRDQAGSRNLDASLDLAAHHLALGEPDQAVQLIQRIFREERAHLTHRVYYRVFRLAARYGELTAHLDEEIMLASIEAAVAIQEMLLAERLLDRISPSDPANQIKRERLLTECLKAAAGRPCAVPKMWKHAQRAANLAETSWERGKIEIRLYLATQLDFARLQQYFDHKYEDALQLYDKIMNGIEDHLASHEEAALFAACARNAADCIIDPAIRPMSEDKLTTAMGYLERGQTVTGRFDLTIENADLLYTEARAYEAAGQDAVAATVLERISDTTITSAYPLMAAIAADRLGWNRTRRGESFRVESVAARLRRLDEQCHVWADRVAMKTRLRSAKLLSAKGGTLSLKQAREFLATNARAFLRLRGLRGSEDAWMAAQSIAGCHVLGEEGVLRWSEFNGLEAYDRLPTRWKNVDPKEIWAETV